MVTQAQNTPVFTGYSDNVTSDVPVFDPWRYIVGLDGPRDVPGVPRPATTISSVAETTLTDHYSGVASMFASISTAGTNTSVTTDHLSGVASMLASTISTIASIVTDSTGESSGQSINSRREDSVTESSDSAGTSADAASDGPVPAPNADNLSVHTAWTGTPLAPGWNNAFPRTSSSSSLVGSDLEELSPEFQLHRELLDS